MGTFSAHLPCALSKNYWGIRSWTQCGPPHPALPATLSRRERDMHPHFRHVDLNFCAISRAAARALSRSSGLKEIAATTAWPPPPYCSQILARLCFRSFVVQGFVPTDTFAREVERLTPTQ